MRWMYSPLFAAAVFLLTRVDRAATLSVCIVSQQESDEISASIPGVATSGAITWTVDDVLTDNGGPKTTFRIEPWDSTSHTLFASDAAGAKICEASVVPRPLPSDPKVYVDPFPVGPQRPESKDLVSTTFNTAVAKPATGAQGGSIAGEVKSSEKEPVVGANVKIINEETGVTRQTTTSSAGSYEVKGLDAGKYHLMVTQPGFSVWEQMNLLVGDKSSRLPLTTPVKVYYATERELITPPPALDYDQKRSASESISYGVAVVTVPKKHANSSFSDPQYWSYNHSAYAASFSPLMQKAEFFSNIALQAAASPGKRSLLVFIHGFNNSFREDIYKTAQLSHDTQFLGVPVMFDWPATTPRIDLVGGYITDFSQVVGSEGHLEDFLESLSKSSGGATINIVAHSMGNRLLLEALDRMRAEHRLPQLGQIVLAAPDIDPGRFKAIIDPLLATHMIARVTMYGSRKDWAMALSKRAHEGTSPVGSIPPVPRCNGIDKVDVSDLPMNIIGHDYFITTRPVLNDIGALLDGRAAPRSGFMALKEGDISYWKLTDLTAP